MREWENEEEIDRKRRERKTERGGEREREREENKIFCLFLGNVWVCALSFGPSLSFDIISALLAYSACVYVCVCLYLCLCVLMLSRCAATVDCKTQSYCHNIVAHCVGVSVCVCVYGEGRLVSAHALLPVFVLTLYYRADGEQTHGHTHTHTNTHILFTRAYALWVNSVICSIIYLQAYYLICVQGVQLLLCLLICVGGFKDNWLWFAVGRVHVVCQQINHQHYFDYNLYASYMAVSSVAVLTSRAVTATVAGNFAQL